MADSMQQPAFAIRNVATGEYVRWTAKGRLRWAARVKGAKLYREERHANSVRDHLAPFYPESSLEVKPIDPIHHKILESNNG